MRVIAVDTFDRPIIREALVLDDSNPDAGLIRWWGGYAWERLEPPVEAEDVLDKEWWRG